MAAILVYDVARICHEANRALQVAQNDPTIPISPPWDELDKHTQDSAVNGVVAVLRSDLTPEQSHENWMQFKLDEGWVYGPVKDEQKKEHPLLVPYSQLSFEAKLKDKLFGAIVRAVKAATLEEKV